MTKTALISFSRRLILLLFCTLVITTSALAEPASPVVSPGQQGEIYSGSIPSGDGIVSVKAVSGKLYQIPAMTPLGVVQALAGTDSIESYQIGDELILKKGILTLDGINNVSSSGDTCWFVLVNNRQLQDYLLPTQDALNTYPLKNGDIILYAFGNPTRPLSEATATMKVSIGAHSGSASQTSIVNNTTPVPTPTIESTIIPTLTPTITPTPVPTYTPVPQNPVISVPVTPTPTPEPVLQSITPVETTDPNAPVHEGSVATEEKVQKSSSSGTKDPNQPVFEDDESGDESVTESTATNTKDPNQPVFEDEESADEHKSGLKYSVPDEKTEEEISEPTETATPTQTPSSKTSASGQNILYEGTMSVPSGNVNVTADSGMDYDISANTPLGLLQMLFTDGKIGSLSISDRGMNKAGILSLTGIDDYQYGDETWFVQINDNTLKDYLNPGTDGFNIKTIGSGDVVTYYYGKQDQVAKIAKAAIYITLK